MTGGILIQRILIGVILLLSVTTPGLRASDHDDGETELKGRSLNITDVYAFREDNQSAVGGDAGNLILIMNTNPRSLPGQQYYFSTRARYDFHITRVTAADKTKKPPGRDDITLRFEFGAPTATNQQSIVFTFIRNGQATRIDRNANGAPLLTTNISDSKNNQLINNQVTVDGRPLTIFAGLREDPFFFDVEQFFKVRDAALKTGRFIGFLPPNQAKDFTQNYNVNAIVLRVPISTLQSAAREPVFDVWTTISIQN
jgi:hypothetical protein